jgi:hypothetical protein
MAPGAARICGKNARHIRTSGMGTNPRPKDNKRVRSRLHKTNLLSSMSKYIGCFLSFTGRVHFTLLWVTGLTTDREARGQKSFVYLEPRPVILNFSFACQAFFLAM